MTIEEIYEMYRRRPGHPSGPHLERLKDLAQGMELAVEFGCQETASAAALLLGATRVISYDIKEHAMVKVLKDAAGPRWVFVMEDTLKTNIPPCGLLFIDSLHTYAQVTGELVRHVDKVQKYLVFHDSITFGSIGARGESGLHSWGYIKGATVPLDHLGIRPAIDALMIRDRSWQLKAHYPDSHGLLVLERCA